MELAEKKGILPEPVERSGAPGADVVSGSLKDGNLQHWSMKSLHTEGPDAAHSADVILKEMEKMKAERLKGGNPHGVLVDLQTIKDPAERASAATEMRGKLDAINKELIESGKEPIPTQFIDPEVKPIAKPPKPLPASEPVPTGKSGRPPATPTEGPPPPQSGVAPHEPTSGGFLPWNILSRILGQKKDKEDDKDGHE